MTRLPTFFALRALEAAARHRSYSRAAAELTVTHGAVSQQIRRLEAELGARLFSRQGNQMVPTPEAQRLAERIGASVAEMRRAVDEFTTSADCDPLVVSMMPQFGHRWLPQRLARLLADPAGANLEFRIEDRMADFVTDGVDMGIRYLRQEVPGVASTLLYQDTLFPVCSPELAAQLRLKAPQDLLGAPLLRHSHLHWRLWFSCFDLAEPPASGPVFEDSLMLVEAAAAGLGVALGRSSLVERDLSSGRLVRPLPQETDNTFAYYVAWRPDSPKLRRILGLRDWLVAEVARTAAEAEGLT